MESVAANMIVMLKMNPTEYGFKLQGFLTARQFGNSLSDDLFFVSGMNCGVRPQEVPNR
jgi:methionine synthase I (cobalamin-dependent)